MNCIFLRRLYPDPAPKVAAVTTSGSGNATYCYLTYNGTKYHTSGNTFEVNIGDTIDFSVYGRSSTYYGEVAIDGVQVLKVTNQTTQTYSWTVPEGVSSITISLSYTSSSYIRNGKITVTTA